MRKTSQDGGDTTSITSGIDNEVKKSVAGIVKTKRNSIKRKVQNLSHESDDGVAEPLLQKEKDKSENLSQSAKYLLSKTKTGVTNEKSDDKDKLLPENKIERTTFGGFSGVTESLVNGTKESHKSYVSGTSAIHNHMNTNIFSSSDGIKKVITPKSQILVEIESNKQGGYSASPLIFTTAKIHTDGKTTHMEPVQVTPVPILSTAEGHLIKTDTMFDNDKIKMSTTPINTNVCKTEDTKQLKNIHKEINTPFSRSSDIVVGATSKNCAPYYARTSDVTVMADTDGNKVPKGIEIQPAMTTKHDVSNPKTPHTTNVPSNEELNRRGSRVLGADVNRNFEASFTSPHIPAKNEISTMSKDNIKIEDAMTNKQKHDEGNLKQSKIDDKSSMIPTSKAKTTAVTTPTEKTVSSSLPTVKAGVASVPSVQPISRAGSIAQSITAMEKLSNTPSTNQSVNEVVLSPKSSAVGTNIVNPVSLPEKLKNVVTTASQITTGVTSTNILGNVKSTVSVSKTPSVAISGLQSTDMSLKNIGSSFKLSTQPTTSMKNKQLNSMTETNLPAIPKSMPVSCNNTSKCNVKPADNTVTRPGTTASISRNVVDSKVTTAETSVTTKTVSPVPACSNISKTTSFSSNSVTSTVKTAPTNKSKLPQSTHASQTTVAAVKPSSTSKSAGATVKQSVTLSSPKSSAKTSTTVNSNKPALSSKTPISSASTPKPSLLHNQNQSLSSEHKRK